MVGGVAISGKTWGWGVVARSGGVHVGSANEEDSGVWGRMVSATTGVGVRGAMTTEAWVVSAETEVWGGIVFEDTGVWGMIEETEVWGMMPLEESGVWGSGEEILVEVQC